MTENRKGRMERRKEDRLVTRASKGDAGAFGRLYDEHVDRIHAFIRARVADASEAEDITATVFLKAWEGVGSYRAMGLPFSAWLFRIARNCVADHGRKKGRSPQTVPEEEAAPLTSSERVEDAAAAMSDKARIREAVRSLSEEQAAVVALRFVWDMSPAEAAAVLGKSEGAVKALQHRAMRNLASVLGKEMHDERQMG